MMVNLLNEGNLVSGIRYWRETKKKWDVDFHNDFYKQLQHLKRNGLTKEWWVNIVPYLQSWRASRGKTDDYIYTRGVERLSELSTEYNKMLGINHSQELDLQIAMWTSIEKLYNVASSIKNVPSPVFGSKLCHFILPNVFPVIDREAVGVYHNDYASYWANCSSEWSECQIKEKLKNILKDSIGVQVIENYPWSTKIAELCMIGSKHQTT